MILGRYKELGKPYLKTKNRCVGKARDSETARNVVLKSDKISNAAEILSEAFFLQRINSPFVVKCFDHFPHKGRYYAVIEFLTEETLETVLEKQAGKLDTEQATRAMVNILSALSAVNAAGVIYRDLHEGHIAYENPNSLKLFDLGYAFPACTSGEELTCINPHDIGTWETMAPEEFFEDTIITQRANVYSAASLFYRLVVGSYPVEVAMKREKLKCKAENEKSTKRDMHLRGKFDFEVCDDSRLRKVLQHGLAAKPEDRFPTVDAFRIALEEVM